MNVIFMQNSDSLAWSVKAPNGDTLGLINTYGNMGFEVVYFPPDRLATLNGFSSLFIHQQFETLNEAQQAILVFFENILKPDDFEGKVL
jgi:hypothetical protein